MRAGAEVQLAGYVQSRTLELGQRYVGMLTDGADWRAYHLRDGALGEVAAFVVSPTQPDVDELLVWLEGVLATSQGLQPTPSEIARRLGAASSSHARQHPGEPGGRSSKHDQLLSLKGLVDLPSKQ